MTRLSWIVRMLPLGGMIQAPSAALGLGYQRGGVGGTSSLGKRLQLVLVRLPVLIANRILALGGINKSDLLILEFSNPQINHPNTAFILASSSANFMSASTMMATSSLNLTFGSQSSCFFALAGSPIRSSTSAGRS